MCVTRAVGLFLLLVVSTVGRGCQKQDDQGDKREKSLPTRSIEAVLEAHTDSLMTIPGVVGTGIGEHQGKPCIKVMIVADSTAIRNRIPSELEGYKVIIDVTGEIKALDAQ